MSQEKSYPTAMHGYNAQNYEQVSQMMLIARAIADGKTETLKMFENAEVIKPNGLLKKLGEKSKKLSLNVN